MKLQKIDVAKMRKLSNTSSQPMSRYTVSTILVGQKRLFTLSNHRNAVIKITI